MKLEDLQKANSLLNKITAELDMQNQIIASMQASLQEYSDFLLAQLKGLRDFNEVEHG